MPAVFVTSTGTDIGKTYVTAGLIRHFRASGRAVHALKPVVSGFNPDDMGRSDPGVLLAALGRSVTAEEINGISPWQFTAPLAPTMAAERDGHSVDFNALVNFCRQAVPPKEMLFIEGVGGVMVPLDDRHTVLDWMTALRLPLIVVVGSYLGTISHTLTALHVLARRNLTTLAVVVSETPGSTVPLDETAATIARFADLIEVIALPRLAATSEPSPAFARIAALLQS